MTWTLRGSLAYVEEERIYFTTVHLLVAMPMMNLSENQVKLLDLIRVGVRSQWVLPDRLAQGLVEPTRRFSHEYAAARAEVWEAIKSLEHDGLLVRHRGTLALTRRGLDCLRSIAKP